MKQHIKFTLAILFMLSCLTIFVVPVSAEDQMDTSVIIDMDLNFETKILVFKLMERFGEVRSSTDTPEEFVDAIEGDDESQILMTLIGITEISSRSLDRSITCEPGIYLCFTYQTGATPGGGVSCTGVCLNLPYFVMGKLTLHHASFCAPFNICTASPGTCKPTCIFH